MVDREPIPKRGWFQFSLRTLFVAMTLVACAFLYPLNWIHERHKLLNENEARMKLAGKTWWDFNRVSGAWCPPRPPAQAPFILRLFGENALDRATFLYIVDESPEGVTPEMLRAQRLFPEANLNWSFVDRNGNFFPAKEE